MSLPVIIIGLGAVGGLWLAKAGPFAETKEQQKSAPPPPTTADASQAPGAADTIMGYPHPQGVMTAPGPCQKGITACGVGAVEPLPKPDNPAVIGGTSVSDGLGLSQDTSATDGTKAGGTTPTTTLPGQSTAPPESVDPKYSPQSPPIYEPILSLGKVIEGNDAGMTARDEGKLYTTWGGYSGHLW